MALNMNSMGIPGGFGASKGFCANTVIFEIITFLIQNIFTLPAPQKTFVDFFFGFAWGFCIEKCRGFFVNLFWSPFPTKRSTETPQKFGENSEQNSVQNSGRKFEKFGAFSFCDFSDLKHFKTVTVTVILGKLMQMIFKTVIGNQWK